MWQEDSNVEDKEPGQDGQKFLDQVREDTKCRWLDRCRNTRMANNLAQSVHHQISEIQPTVAS